MVAWINNAQGQFFRMNQSPLPFILSKISNSDKWSHLNLRQSYAILSSNKWYEWTYDTKMWCIMESKVFKNVQYVILKENNQALVFDISYQIKLIALLTSMQYAM